jgi:hypothetical protein
VWSGGNPNVTRAINDSFLINMGPNNATGYYRGPGRRPHNLYTSTDNIWFQTPPDQPGPPPQQFEYLEADETVRRRRRPRACRSASAREHRVDLESRVRQVRPFAARSAHDDKTSSVVSVRPTW